jgi:hypothetical protein
VTAWGPVGACETVSVPTGMIRAIRVEEPYFLVNRTTLFPSFDAP